MLSDVCGHIDACVYVCVYLGARIKVLELTRIGALVIRLFAYRKSPVFWEAQITNCEVGGTLLEQEDLEGLEWLSQSLSCDWLGCLSTDLLRQGGATETPPFGLGLGDTNPLVS